MTVQATFVATLVDEWARGGVLHAVVSPGSRSTPLAIALANEGRIEIHVRLDERSAGFFAIGLALRTRSPVVVVTTSGTATAELHPAVMEADLACVPLIIATADRPPELHEVGAPQTANQVGLFGAQTRYAVDVGVPDEASMQHWRSIASRLVAESMSSPRGRGPVHVNLAFREPLVGHAGDLPVGRPDDAPWHRVLRSLEPSPAVLDEFLMAITSSPRGVLIAGRGAAAGDGSSILRLAEQLKWPVLCDPQAFPRAPHPNLIARYDGMLRSERAKNALQPEIIVHLGAPPSSAECSAWVAGGRANRVLDVLVDPSGKFEDPERVAALVVGADPELLCDAACDAFAHRRDDVGALSDVWLSRWQDCERAAECAIDATLDGHGELSEPEVVRAIVAALPDNAVLVVSSSMPIRDVEWFAHVRDGAPRVISNRGVNGIDGVTSTVLGVAAGALRQDADASPVVGVVGDLAFFHDLSGLAWGQMEKRPAATLIVIDNGGGGIFSFLAQARELPEVVFDRFFATTHGASCTEVAAALGCEVAEVGIDGLHQAVSHALRRDGTKVIVVRTDRAKNVAVHQAINDAIVQSVDEKLQSLV